MALTKAKKNEKVAMLAKELESSTSAIIGTFKGLTASKDFELRKAIRAAGGSYHVVKNKLAAKSAEGTKVEEALKGLKGVSSVAYTSGDPVALAKALADWVKDNSEFTFKLGIVDGKLISAAEVDQLAKMPGKEELFGKLLFLINSPAQRLATVINATGRDLAVVVNQAVEQGKFGGAAA
jgi:large subunit ribosomal protein L10